MACDVLAALTYLLRSQKNCHNIASSACYQSYLFSEPTPKWCRSIFCPSDSFYPYTSLFSELTISSGECAENDWELSCNFHNSLITIP